MALFLITGGAGFVGSHLIARLEADGHQAIAVDDLSNGSGGNLAFSRAKLLKLDISSESFIPTLLGSYPEARETDAVFHLACFPRSLSFQRPLRDVEVNVGGTVNVLELARRLQCKVIFSSNSGIYGTPERLPITEESPDLPSSPYDVDKLAAEYHMRVCHKAFGIPVTIFRFATIYGSRQRVTHEWKPVIAEFVTRMLRGEAPTIDGDGNQTRDFIHVSDLVNALAKSAFTETGDAPIILSSHTETSINQLYETLARLLCFPKPPLRGPAKMGDVRRMWYDNSKARGLLGWTPTMTLERALQQDVIPYYRNKMSNSELPSQSGAET